MTTLVMYKKDVEYLQSLSGKETFLTQISATANILQACAAVGVNPAALIIVRREDVAFNALIREFQAYHVDIMVDRLEHIEDEFEDPHMARVASENIKWLATKRLREIYGERQDVVVTHKIDLTDVLEEAKRRTFKFIDGKVLNSIDSSTVNKTVELAPETPDVPLQDIIDPLS